ncbi:hypothetical protein PV327_010724 [Microctonus hyperodae]|uniref:Major facilitator superfamily (MFS) profile domain-containing protein n=1 Tax=Microctonus hyperodae TaxID=165561 RepID=A0AA39EZ17_MICHY|nr:hypothetical protein PV327_010724 [Microctonus hyperodae]
MDCMRGLLTKWKRQPILIDNLETLVEKSQRWRSIYVIYFTMFLMSLGFSIVLTGVWPYLDELDPTAGKVFMGYVVAANPLGQMLFSPIVGWWANKRGSIRLPLLITLLIFIIASAIYSTLELMPGDKKSWMIAARFAIGVSSANIAAARSYLSAATRLSERTQAVSMVSLAQVLGFVVGPALQTAVTPLGKVGYYIFGMPFNMYTMSGWINVLLSIMNFILFLPWNFTEHKIAAREAMKEQGKSSEKETWKSMKPDYLAAWTLICAFFILVFNFVLLETLGTPLTMDQFAWTKEESLYYMGLLLSVGAIIACIMFLIIGPLCKRFEERRVMLWFGFFFMVVGRIFCIPWGPDPPKIAEIDPFTNTTKYLNGTDITGCPSDQKWCYYTPQMTVIQFVIGYTFTTIGYPVGVTLVQTIFSKILGPRPQGLWMGLMTGAGCASRVLGPVFVGLIYTQWGTYHTFGITGITLIIAMMWIQIVDKRLLPLTTINKSTKNNSLNAEENNGELLDVEQPLFNKINDNKKDIEMQTLNTNVNCDKD